MRLRLVSLIFNMALVSAANAAPYKRMPIDFVGDWCSPRRDNGRIDYKLPSWTDDGKCTDILSVDKLGFYFADQKKTCTPVNLRVKEDKGPSGTAYFATISARCITDGVVTTGQEGKVQTFDFKRYKGSLLIKASE